MWKGLKTLDGRLPDFQQIPTQTLWKRWAKCVLLGSWTSKFVPSHLDIIFAVFAFQRQVLFKICGHEQWTISFCLSLSWCVQKIFVALIKMQCDILRKVYTESSKCVSVKELTRKCDCVPLFLSGIMSTWPDPLCTGRDLVNFCQVGLSSAPYKKKIYIYSRGFTQCSQVWKLLSKLWRAFFPPWIKRMFCVTLSRKQKCSVLLTLNSKTFKFVWEPWPCPVCITNFVSSENLAQTWLTVTITCIPPGTKCRANKCVQSPVSLCGKRINVRFLASDFFRPSATVSRIGLVESRLSLVWRTPPPWLADPPWLATPPTWWMVGALGLCAD